MDATERKALKLLNSLGFESVVFEPRGQVTPDFLANDELAVEVTRLTKGISLDGGLHVVDSDEVSIHRSLRLAIQSFDGQRSDRSVFVSYTIRRPIDLRVVVQQLKAHLRSLLAQPTTPDRQFRVSAGLTVDFDEAMYRPGRPYLLGAYSDHDRAGWVVSDLLENIVCVAEEKREKAIQLLNPYSQWWLILENRLTTTVSESSFIDLIGHLSTADFDRAFWGRCILYDPRDPLSYRQLW